MVGVRIDGNFVHVRSLEKVDRQSYKLRIETVRSYGKAYVVL